MYMQRLIALGAATLLPHGMVLAQTPDMAWFKVLLWQISGILNLLMPALIALAFAVFVWGLVVFIAHSGNEQKTDEGKQKMLWGVLILFVIISIWGILGLMKKLTGTQVAGMGTVEEPAVPQ